MVEEEESIKVQEYDPWVFSPYDIEGSHIELILLQNQFAIYNHYCQISICNEYSQGKYFKKSSILNWLTISKFLFKNNINFKYIINDRDLHNKTQKKVMCNICNLI